MRTASAGRSTPFAQRAQVVGNALRQHRNDPVGEVDRIAAQPRLRVELGAGPHIPGDIRDRDGDDMAARIGGILVRPRVHGVVVVLRIARIDRHERKIAPVGPVFHRGGSGAFGLGHHSLREDVRNGMGVQRDRRDCPLRRHRSDHVGDGACRQTATLVLGRFDLDEVAVLGIARGARRNHVFQLTALDGLDPPSAARRRPEDADGAGGAALELADDLGARSRVALVNEFCQHPVADADGRTGRRPAQGKAGAGAALVLVPARGIAEEAAVRVAGAYFEDPDRRQLARATVALPTAFQQPLGLKVGQDVLEDVAVVTLHAERLGQIALGGATRVFGEEAEHRLPAQRARFSVGFRSLRHLVQSAFALALAAGFFAAAGFFTSPVLAAAVRRAAASSHRPRRLAWRLSSPSWRAPS